MGTRNIQYAPNCGEVEKNFFTFSFLGNIAHAEHLVWIREMEIICIIVVQAQNIAEPDAAAKRCKGSICVGNMGTACQISHGDLLLDLNNRTH